MGKLALVKTAITRGFGRGGLRIKNARPEIFMGLGIVAGIGTVVFACVQTLKVEEVLDKTKADLNKINTTHEEKPEVYSAEDRQKDLVTVYARTGWAFIKLYGPPAALGAVSTALIIYGNRVLRKENAALTAAYMALSESFKKYRERVIKDLGEEKNREYLYGTKREQIVDVDEDGNETVREELVQSQPNISIYAKYFNESNPNWRRSPEINLAFLRGAQQQANDELHARGHLFLNRVYQILGMPETEFGQYVGWIVGNGDSAIDFGIYQRDNEDNQAFILGFARSILLDFNVDGPISDIFAEARDLARVGPRDDITAMVDVIDNERLRTPSRPLGRRLRR